MIKIGWLSLSLSTLIFAAFSASGTKSLNSYSVGPGGTNQAQSNNYSAQATVGEQANGSAHSNTYTVGNGEIQTEQITVPPAPTVGNGGGIYFNMLSCTINTGTDPSDATYAIAVSTNNFVTTNYVQGGDTLGSSPVFQSYSSWGSGSGFDIIGLTPSTTYEVKVSAKQGQFTNTEYGAYTSASTVASAISFSLTPNSSSLGTFLPGTVVTSSNLDFTFATTGTYGGTIYVNGLNGGFYSPSKTYLIAATTANLATASQGFGIQGTNPAQTSGGPLSVSSPYNSSANNVGTESSTYAPIFTSANSIVGGTANANIQIKAPSTAPAASDYSETLTFIAAASF